MSLLRIIDANLNRAREGLRVVEEHARFVLADAALAASAKRQRHNLAAAAAPFELQRLAARDTPGDVGTRIKTPDERRRAGTHEVALANLRRVQEALRVLEEYAKIEQPAAARAFERLRYRAYALETALARAANPLAQARLMLLYTRAVCRGDPEATLHAALAAGVDAVQWREPPGAYPTERARFTAGERVRAIAREHGAAFVVNDRADLARALDADGLHLGQTDLPAGPARKVLGALAWIGVSTHTAQERAAALAGGANYLGAGPMFQSSTKDAGAVRGPAYLRETLAATDRPVFAIGGITPENVAALVAVAGERLRIAVSQAVLGVPEVAEGAGALHAALEASGEK